MRRKLSFTNETHGRHIVMDCPDNWAQMLLALAMGGLQISNVTVTQY